MNDLMNYDPKYRKMMRALLVIIIVLFLLRLWMFAIMPLFFFVLYSILEPELFVLTFAFWKKTYYDFQGKLITNPIEIIRLDEMEQQRKRKEYLKKNIVVNFNIENIVEYKAFYQNNKEYIDNFIKYNNTIRCSDDNTQLLKKFFESKKIFKDEKFFEDIANYALLKNKVEELKNKLIGQEHITKYGVDELVNKYISIFNENSLDDDNTNLFSYIIVYEKEINISKLSLTDKINNTYNMIKSAKKEDLFYRTLNSSIKVNCNSSVSIEKIDSMDWLEFEKFSKDLFQKMGFKVILTKATGDQGADLLLEKYDEKIAVQVKHYNQFQKVGNKAVQEVIAAQQYYKCCYRTGYLSVTWTR